MPPSDRDDDGLADDALAAAAQKGRGVIKASWIGTGIFTVSAVATAIAPRTFVAVGVGVAMVMFFVGIGLFVWAYAVAVNRSRTDLIGLGGLFFLAGSAPRPVQWSLLGSLAVEVVVGIATAAVHPFTPLAFGVLASMYGLALCGVWAAKWGTFPPRPPEEPRKKRGAARAAASSDTRPAKKATTSGRVTAPKDRSRSRTKAGSKPGSKSGSKSGPKRRSYL
jgi:hypothetical protein